MIAHGVSRMHRLYVATLCGKNAFTHTPGLGVVWGSKHDVLPPNRRAHHAVLPTKTSQQYIHCAGSSIVFLKAGSRVSSASFMNF